MVGIKLNKNNQIKKLLTFKNFSPMTVENLAYYFVVSKKLERINSIIRLIFSISLYLFLLEIYFSIEKFKFLLLLKLVTQ